jgi:prepilin-type N-terminal cleavage/methylation domain-containing protein
MRNSKPSIGIRRSSVRPAFTLIECLISLAITAILMTAVAAAFKASVVSYGENEEIFWTINNARQALARMTAQLRTAGYVDPNGVVYGVPHLTSPGPSCTVYKADESGNMEIIRFEYRTNNKLYLVKGNTSTSPEYVLCDGVTAATFTTISKNAVDATGVQISLTVQSGDSRRTLSAAAVIRRNLSQ